VGIKLLMRAAHPSSPAPAMTPMPRSQSRALLADRSFVGALILALVGFSVHGDDAAELAPADVAGENPSDRVEIMPPPDGEAAEEAGHSMHGEAFNEGPRQRAYLMGNTGNVTFPCTCAGDEVQAFVNQGIGQLHGFWYFEAERSFRQAAALDPECAIAYWGIAMANANNETRAKEFIAEAAARKEHITRREQLYIESLERYLNAAQEGDDWDKNRRQTFVNDLEDIMDEFPDDLEAQAFLALQIWNNRSKGIPISSYFAVDALLQGVLEVNPLHPCHHYVIHLWDHERSERALESASLCGESAPGIAHMWHMPGHIYSNLRRYHEAVWQQEASARVDHAHMMRDLVLPDQIHNFAHNNEWLIRNLVHVGRAHDAMDLAVNMCDMPRHPDYNTESGHGSSYYGRLRLFEVLDEFEMWDELVALSDTVYLEPTDKESEQVKRLRHLGRACFLSNRSESGVLVLEDLRTRKTQIETERETAAETARQQARDEGKPDAEVERAGEDAKGQFQERLRVLEKAIQELEGLQFLAQSDFDHAIESFEAAGDVARQILARAHLGKGDVERALELMRNLVSSNEDETVPLACQVDILWQAGRTDEARAAFEELRKISSDIDLAVPVFARLAAPATELGFGADWRVPFTPAEDFGTRPELDTLGPFRWSPTPAAPWTLQDHEARTYALSDFQGRPVIVIFYLGYGCLHCAEQLKTFAPLTGRFAEAGVDLIAVSTDTPALLLQSHANYSEGVFPFPLVSDSDLNVFKAYRCYDDFENITLHGTFLIDGAGMIRWHDISYEPFMDAEFLLRESQRLLSQDGVNLTPADAEAVSVAPAGTSE
jgi:peroxiredoxin